MTFWHGKDPYGMKEFVRWRQCEDAKHIVKRVHVGGKNAPKIALLKSFGKECFYCGIALEIGAVTKDHVIPKSRGGAESGNIVPSCSRCNSRKGNRMPTESEVARFVRKCGHAPKVKPHLIPK